MKTIAILIFSILCIGFSAIAQPVKKNINLANKEWVDVNFKKGQPVFIVADKQSTQQRYFYRLSDYLQKVIKISPVVVHELSRVPRGIPVILLSRTAGDRQDVLALNGSEEAFILRTVNVDAHHAVLALAKTEAGLKRAVQRMVLKSIQGEEGLKIPALNIAERPWIEKREWALCPWSPDRVRRSFSNPEADKRLNVWLYSDQQIADYVEMFDWLGFSGSQLMETCTNYASMGSREAFQDKLLKFARAARSNIQDVTYWVWAAQFDDYGWRDSEVTYAPRDGNTAFNDPAVRKAFEKYYNGYAKMAPYVDLLIAHFYDPGELKNREDVFSYLKLLNDKFRKINPAIKLGIDFWAAGSSKEYMEQLIANGLGSSLLLEMSLPIIYKEGQREELHRIAKEHKLSLGMWGWYNTEYETDQRPMMHVNAKALKGFYRQVKQGADAIHPLSYWSEMEAYHLNNIFTMYASGQLLWNPDRDTDEILNDISEGIFGPVNGTKVFDALKLIEDTRSGPTWNTFWWQSKEYRLGTAHPGRDMQRADKAIADLENFKTDTAYIPKFPLPFPCSTFIELMLPHLKQIRQFAAFRVDMEQIKDAAKKQSAKEVLTEMARKAWQPIPDYNTWIGVFGQPEATMQEKMMLQLAKDYQLEIERPGWLLFREAHRFLQRIQYLQQSSSAPFLFRSNDMNIKGEFNWSDAKMKECLDLLIKIGVVVATGNEQYGLSNWQDYSPLKSPLK